MRFQGYRRLRGSHAPFEKVEGAEGETRGQAYERLMHLSELAAGEGQFEYQVMPGDTQPSTYRHRQMRPV